MQTELSPINIVRLFELNKSERGEFATQIIERIESGEADPIQVHLQLKCAEDLIKQVNSNDTYKSTLLDAAEKNGKSFTFHNSKFEIKEVGVKYDFEKCNDPEWYELNAKLDALKDEIKAREMFLKTVSQKGLEIVTGEGEVITIYPPVKTSTTSVAVTLK